MEETDPFGREKGEDPLAEMGWSGGGSTAAPDTAPSEVAPPERPDRAAQRAPVAPPSAPAPRSAPAPPSRHRPFDPTVTSGGIPGQGRRVRGTGCVFALVVLGILGAIAGAVIPAVIDAVDTVQEQVDDINPTVPDVDDDGPGGAGGDREQDARPPQGLERRSMLRRGNLSPALRRLERVTGSSRVRLIRIDATRVIVQTATRGGGTRLAQATWDGETNVLSTSPGGGGTTFAWSQIDASAPNRIASGATRGRRASSFDYAVLIDAAGLRWSAFLKGGRGTYQADPDGTNLRKIG